MGFRFVADDADDRAINAAAEVRSQSECFDPFDDVLDLFVRRRWDLRMMITVRLVASDGWEW